MPSTISTAIVCLVILIIAVFSIKSYIKKLSSGCCGSGGDKPERIKPKDCKKSNYPYSKVVKISGMSCKNCAARIENAFNSLDGYYAKVNLKKNEALILMKQPTDDNTIKEIIHSSGYKAIAIYNSQ